ncbi:hydantoinase B/oxoprolinase family protein [Thiohalophilus thiocyanatoxydans]|uniref:N-methylhydantoinase B n=1 Tax=Thiohalophilus thiocyanatoxydans TaxID=381308 RepID=A0A4R8IPL5_9GAMM|nr:hydantoinase B/oxoprolinase family protein [Thiohalophilus thiocyanatoxydans]TDX99348.1 N-methylhydantoinase B [Thiohalophilus thiocyanatoxydans]
MDAVDLSIFSSRLDAVCDEMGAVLQRAAFSPNIRDRLDFSCAIFDAQGRLCAQAAHIPVHLGSMAYAMRDIVRHIDWQAGDMVIVNDPYLGGTHLPDVTVIAPLFVAGECLGYVANRAHHADIGAESPGSMPLSSTLEEEGLVLPPTKLVVAGELDSALLEQIVGQVRSDATGRGDFAAQMSANRAGLGRLAELIAPLGKAAFVSALAQLNDYAERLARTALTAIPDGDYAFVDYLDDDGLGHTDLAIAVKLRVRAGEVSVDFEGTAPQTPGNVNCPLSVAAAAVYYVFRCLMPPQTPASAGSFRPLTLQAPEGCLVNAQRPAAVAAGNVETSSRIVDAVMGALAQAIPGRIPAASHGSMNNLAMGHAGGAGVPAWDYYETIGGGMGAGHAGGGLDGVQTHMTNTRNTPLEVLEANYPVRLRRYALRSGSGGAGQRRGGDGLIREFEFLAPASVTLLTERRTHAPWGLEGGEAGQPGINRLNGEPLPGKIRLNVNVGDVLSIETPGGGGFGNGGPRDE